VERDMPIASAGRPDEAPATGRILATLMPGMSIHGCTVASNAYIAHARVLAESFLTHNPGSSFSVLIVDDTPEPPPRNEPFEVLTPTQVGLDQMEFDRRATMYTAQGLACSLKPVLLLAMLDRFDGTTLYLDADGCVYSGLESLAEACEQSSLLLSPHMMDPYPLTGLDSPEQLIMRAGAFNGGLLAVSPGAEQAMRWWAQRTARRCVFDEARGLLFDQTWLTLIPLLFESQLLRDRGCNVAGWNLHTRDVEWQAERPFIDGGPLRHFHFAGSFDPEHPQTITPIEHLASWWAKLDERPGAARIVREYAQRLIASGYREARASKPRLDLMPDGASIAPWMRESYRIALLEAEESGAEEPPNPFSHGQERFQRWVGQRAGEAAACPSGDQTPAAVNPALADALMDSERLLARIAELESIRDENMRWAERVSSELQETIADRDRYLRMMESVWSSPTWRLTKPLRQAKAALKRAPEDSGP
jgi:hypothetical protein